MSAPADIRADRKQASMPRTSVRTAAPETGDASSDGESVRAQGHAADTQPARQE